MCDTDEQFWAENARIQNCPWPATGQWVELCLPPMTESRQRPGSELSPQHTEPGQGGVSKKFSPAGPGSRGCRPGLCSPQGASRSLRTQKLGREVPSSVAGPKPLQAKARFNLESPWMERGKNTACLGFPGGANGKRIRLQCRRFETKFQSLGQEDSLEEKMAAHSSTLAWRIPWIEEPHELQSMESQSQT